MKYILDQVEYDTLTGKSLNYNEWLSKTLEEVKYMSFVHQSQPQEKYLIKAYQLLIKAKEDNND